MIKLIVCLKNDKEYVGEQTKLRLMVVEVSSF